MVAFLRQAGDDGGHRRLRLRARDAGFKTRDQVERVRSAISKPIWNDVAFPRGRRIQARVDRHRRPQITRQSGLGADEALRRPTDNCESQTAEADTSAY